MTLALGATVASLAQQAIAETVDPKPSQNLLVLLVLVLLLLELVVTALFKGAPQTLSARRG